MGPQGGEDVVEAALVEFVAALPAPPVREVGAGAVDGLGGLEQVLPGVPYVDDLDGAGGVLVGPVPGPRGAVAEDDAAGASWKPRRAASRRARRANGAGSGSVSRLAIVSMAAL